MVLKASYSRHKPILSLFDVNRFVDIPHVQTVPSPVVADILKDIGGPLIIEHGIWSMDKIIRFEKNS